MKKEELMIGDLVSLKTDCESIVKVVDICKDGFVSVQQVKYPYVVTDYIRPKELQDIQLTDEILANNGWKESHFDDVYQKNHLFLCKQCNGIYSLHDKAGELLTKTIASVSQLQHLLYGLQMYSKINIGDTETLRHFKVIQLQHQLRTEVCPECGCMTDDFKEEVVPHCIATIDTLVNKNCGVDINTIYKVCNINTETIPSREHKEKFTKYGLDVYPTSYFTGYCDNDIYIIGEGDEENIDVLGPDGWLTVNTEKDAQCYIIRKNPKFSLDNILNAKDFE